MNIINIVALLLLLLVFLCNSPQCARACSFMRFLYHNQRRTTLGRTHLDEWLARRSDFYLTKQNTQQPDIHARGKIRTQNDCTNHSPHSVKTGGHQVPLYLRFIVILSFVLRLRLSSGLFGSFNQNVCFCRLPRVCCMSDTEVRKLHETFQCYLF
jgi:hypothetical protein